MDKLAPYLGTPSLVIRQMIKLTEPQYGDRVIDIGSGKGNILIGFAKKCPYVKCLGYEIDRNRVEESRRRIRAKGLEDRIEIVHGNVFDYNLGDADIVTTFLTTKGMRKIEDKVLKELPSSSRLVSHEYGFQKVEPNKLRFLFDLSDLFPKSPFVFALHFVEVYWMNDLITRRTFREFLMRKKPKFPLSEFKSQYQYETEK